MLQTPSNSLCHCAGGVLMGFVYPFNLKEIGNGVALWLGIEPYELFFYIFLPPLLLDAALKIDWYIFKKVGGGAAPQRSAGFCFLSSSAGSGRAGLLQLVDTVHQEAGIDETLNPKP